MDEAPWFWYLNRTILFLPLCVGIVIGLIVCWLHRKRSPKAIRRVAAGLIVLLAEVYFGQLLVHTPINNFYIIADYLPRHFVESIPRTTRWTQWWPPCTLRATGVLLILWGTITAIRTNPTEVRPGG